VGSLKTQLAFHGVLILTICVFAGRFFARAINNQSREVAWRVVHSGGSMGGVMLIAFASVLDLAYLPYAASNAFVWFIVLGTWALVIGMIAAAVTGERGLRWGASSIGRSIYAVYVVGAISSLVGCGILVFGLARAL